ncbi:hypothetical protein [Cerasicoccus fimbriatus]|uniref:hypothetical protein n=1 Tax=Cerasicoccus fimbriatus TaxID=3014554 RepID=UPI0022B5926F|nr:hypothetical protein [Cerasicoccus sp. TK19100]
MKYLLITICLGFALVGCKEEPEATTNEPMMTNEEKMDAQVNEYDSPTQNKAFSPTTPVNSNPLDPANPNSRYNQADPNRQY